MGELGQHFADYHFLVFENDSDDLTSQKMKEVASQDAKYEFKSEKLGLEDERNLQVPRMHRMAYLRNRLHAWVADKFQSGQHWDLIAVNDFDMNLYHQHAISPHGFFAALGRENIDSWDMICANSLRHAHWAEADNNEKGSVLKVGYYDCFALRMAGFDEFNQMCEFGATKYMFRSYDLYKVHSCFGGLGLYKPEKFLSCSYDPESADCEHVSMHTCMRQKGGEGRMFMDPMLTTLYDDNIGYKCKDSREIARSVGQQ